LPNSTQYESINPILHNTDVSTIIDQEVGSDNIMMLLERDFKETIEREVQQYNKELLNFIDAEIKQISGTGL
jgi:glutathionyl-hydroquinone reductase